MQIQINKKTFEWIERFSISYKLGLKIKKTINEDDTQHGTFYLNSKAETIIHNADIDSVFKSIYSTFMIKIRK